MQLIAMLSMLVDHIGIVFFEDHLWLRIIGRIAFPIYAYALVQGDRYTRSKPQYLTRLFALALLSQIPYQLALNPGGLNVIATLFMAAAVMQILDRKFSPWGKGGIVLAACVFMQFFSFDYGAYGLLLVLSFRFFASERLLFAQLLLNLFYLLIYGPGGLFQLLSIVPTLLIVYGPTVWKKLEHIRVRKWVWRSFYPLHLSVLAVMKWAEW
ncbi:TraX family protein [Paenibacillus sp.]|uniref:TraX family protein n=1 Tax=Paenibacillus sp. TaxID=58172 RepID=UPI0028325DC2|nr:TraX family protein [Paenibacillus sp.]MDR0268229.1 conjugal transfer protein TraX [Paenibacillus sp.]